jgi:hypothetical protein
MAVTVAQARSEVQMVFEQTLAWADEGERRSFFSFESGLWTRLLALGRAFVVLFLARQTNRPRSVEYSYREERWRLNGERATALGTRFGKVVFSRICGRRIGLSRRHRCDLPLDRELNLCGGFSLGVVTAMTRLCAQMAFASARENFRETSQWAPSQRAVMRMVDAVGDQAKIFLEQAGAPTDDGDVLVIQVDGKGAPMISPEEHRRRSRPHDSIDGTESSPRRWRRKLRRKWPKKPRRTGGKKSKNAKAAIVGVVYTLQQTASGTEGPINKRLLATFESHEALFVWLSREAQKRGYGKKRTLFLGDGSEHIWRMQQKYFPEAEVCIDWCHVVEKLWMAGECLYEEGSDELKKWMAKQTTRLRRGKSTAIIDELEQLLEQTSKTGPGNKGKRRRLEKALKYLTDHRARLRYAELRRDDLDIGTGAVEGAVRNLVGIRLDGPGMRWSRQRSERVLHLRCILLNRQWSEFTDHLHHLDRLVLSAQPEPTVTHSATAA